MTTPSRFFCLRLLDLRDSTRRKNALAPSLKRSLPDLRNRETVRSLSGVEIENGGSVLFLRTTAMLSHESSFVRYPAMPKTIRLKRGKKFNDSIRETDFAP